MLDPDNIANFQATTVDLEELIMFWVAAAGKDAHSTAAALDRFLTNRHISWGSSPFEVVRLCGSSLSDELRKCGFGCYNQRATSFRWLANCGLELHRCLIDDLILCPGINLKTAKGFLLYTRPWVRHAIVDRHFLREMKELGHAHAPENTPQSRRQYEYWEAIGLAEADRLGLDPVEFDKQLWLKRRRGRKSRGQAVAEPVLSPA